MIKVIKKTGILFASMLSSVIAFAQDDQPIEMADGLYQSGKIYVVVAVLSVIFIGIVAYLISIDRKVSKLEKASPTPPKEGL
ncbi:MAG: CcmD family protein [Bacteroidota bacterium]